MAKRRKEAMAKNAESKAKEEAESKAVAADGRQADHIERRVAQMGLGDYSVIVKDDIAIVNGKAPDQETREKVILAVGNIYGIATVRDYIRIAKDSAESTMYTVQSGDSLSKIAKEVYGDAMKYPVIFEANKPMLTDPDLIYPGQVLRIPAQ